MEPKRFARIASNPAWMLAGLVGALAACTPYPRLLDPAFDPGGRGLNSQFDERSPDVAGRYVVFVSERQRRENI